MLGVDGRRRFVEGGRMAFPFLRHLLWQGQHMQYRDRLQGRLQRPPEPINTNLFEVSLFEREVSSLGRGLETDS